MKKRIVILVAVVAVLIAAFWIVRARRANGASTYRFTQVERGDVTQVVSTTGTLQAIKSVQVGTQVSGQLSAIFVDFNDHVRKGQLLARIDPTLLQQEVRSAEANVERASASLDEKKREFGRDTLLFARKVLSESDYETSRYNYRVALADLQSAQVSLARARRNLAYTEITSPIDGVVVERNVDVGQTVAASLSAPQLFLHRRGPVGDADPGLGGRERHRPDPAGPGRVVHRAGLSERDVQGHGAPGAAAVDHARRTSSTTRSSISLENPDGRLLPGMTATVDFIVAKATDVLTVANAALRFQPDGRRCWRNCPSGQRPDVDADRTGGAGGRERSGPRDSTLAPRRRGRAPHGTSFGRLWYLDEKGKLA